MSEAHSVALEALKRVRPSRYSYNVAQENLENPIDDLAE